MTTRITIAGKTDVGKKRNHNEDNFLMIPDENLFVVADGMGGHSSGEIASQIAVGAIANFFNATRQDEDITWPYKMDKNRSYNENRFIMAIKLANLRIYETAQREFRYRGMGTTVAGVNFTGKNALVAHVGDSRIYRMHNNKLTQLTEDHSLLNDYLKAKTLTEKEIQNFPHKNIIVRALGMKDGVMVDMSQHEIQPEDVFLGCSDGLSGMLSDAQIFDVIKTCSTDLEKACEKLIAMSNDAGGMDNITAVLAYVHEV